MNYREARFQAEDLVNTLVPEGTEGVMRQKLIDGIQDLIFDAYNRGQDDAFDSASHWCDASWTS